MVKPFLSENACFFNFLNNKSKTCGWQFLFMCYFTCQGQKIPFIAILTWVLILGKIEDGDHCWWRHLPSAECGYEFTCSLRVTLLIESSDGRKNQKRYHLIYLPIFYWLHWNDREECSRGLVLSGTVLLKNIMFFTIIALHVQLYFVRVVGCIAL